MATSRQKQTQKAKTRVLVVDDHPIVRQGLKQLIDHEPDLIVCGEAADRTETLNALKKKRPDICILDISLKRDSGLELIKQIRARGFKLPILVLSMHSESLYAERVLRAGGQGYVMKNEGAESLLTAVRQVLAGTIYLSTIMSGHLISKVVAGQLDGRAPIETLSDRELDVFRLIGFGRTTREIAEELGLSVKTIESYRAHIKKKLTLKSATQLVQHATRWLQEESGT